MQHDGFRIPDRVFACLAILTLALIWGVMIWANPALPPSIPTHFGPSGYADAWATKSFWNVFALPILGTVFGGLFLWVYHHPQYSNIPSSVLLTEVPEPQRSVLTRLIRHFLVIIYVIMTLIFANITLATIQVAFDPAARLDPWAMSGLVILLLMVCVVYSIWLAKVARSGTAKMKRLRIQRKKANE